MPETKGNVICAELVQPISDEGYRKLFIPLVERILEHYSDISMLMYYKNFKGWEEGAAKQDLQAQFDYGQKVRRVALVNPPQKELLSRKVRQPLVSGEMRCFEEKDLEEALLWVQEKE